VEHNTIVIAEICIESWDYHYDYISNEVGIV
jgi:hypothetical protein